MLQTFRSLSQRLLTVSNILKCLLGIKTDKNCFCCSFPFRDLCDPWTNKDVTHLGTLYNVDEGNLQCKGSNGVRSRVGQWTSVPSLPVNSDKRDTQGNLDT